MNGPQTEVILARAAARIQRYPRPVVWLQWFAAVFAEYLLPLLLLRQWRRASSLDDVSFDLLEQRTHGHPALGLRGMFLLLRLPLWEQLYAESRPARRAQHPLAKAILSRPIAPRNTHYDVAVIGSGAGGAPLAWELSRQGYRVAVIERGGLVKAQTAPGALERYYTQQALLAGVGPHGAMVAVMQGENLGGTTPINSGTSLTPRVEFLRSWDWKTGLPFSQGLLESSLERVQQLLGVDVPDEGLLGPSGALFANGLAALGCEGAYVLPRNTPTCVGLGRCPFGCPGYHKRSTDVAFLPAAVEAGCELYVATNVRRIREVADGVRLDIVGKNGLEQIHTNLCVLAAGALGTPRLIRANRLGARWRRAGDNLKLHPASKVLAMMPDPVHGERGVAQGMGYIDPHLERIVFEGIFTPRATVAPVLSRAGRSADFWLNNYDRVASFGMMVLDRSSGSIRWCGGVPIIRYGLHPDDANELVRGMQLMGEAYLAAGAERILLPLLGVDNEFSDVAGLNKIRPEDIHPWQILSSGFHPQGTAAMGRVTTQEQQLQGSEHIYVSDASLLPDTPGVNPQLTIMALSLRLAGILDQRLSG